MGTSLMRHASWFSRTITMKLIVPLLAPIAIRIQGNKSPLRTTSKSAADALRACFDTQTLGNRPRAVYLDGNEQKAASDEARDETKRTTLWRDSIVYAGLKEGDTILREWR